MPQPKQRFCSEAPSPVHNPHKQNYNNINNKQEKKRGISINADNFAAPKGNP